MQAHTSRMCNHCSVQRREEVLDANHISWSLPAWPTDQAKNINVSDIISVVTSIFWIVLPNITSDGKSYSSTVTSNPTLHNKATTVSTTSGHDKHYHHNTNAANMRNISNARRLRKDHQGTYREPLSPSCPLFLITDQERHLHNKNDTALNSSLWQSDFTMNCSSIYAGA